MMEDVARVTRMDDLFCEYVGRMACMRVGMYVQSGALCSFVEEDPPAPNADNGHICASCSTELEGAECGRLLCAQCRSCATVHHGPPLIETMYRSAHPKYVLSQKKEKIAANIFWQRAVATQENELAQQLANASLVAYQRWKDGRGDMNVRFTPEDLADCGGSYAKEMIYCNPRYIDEQDTSDNDGGAQLQWPRHDPIRLGGLGVRLLDSVKQLVREWLQTLDAMIRRHFNIPLTRHNHGESPIRVAVESFAELIANRVVLLEEQVDDDATQHVCTEGFAHRAEMEEVRCKHMAARKCSSDVRSMRELMALAKGGVVPEDPRRLIEFLGSPCPELLKALPGVCVSSAMRFEELQGILDEGSEVERRLHLWADSVNVGALCLLLEVAIRQAQEWKTTSFLHCLRHDAASRDERLPPQGWVDEPQIASWSLVSKKTHAHRRTGLDPMGQRVVLMSSALIQINGDGGFFRPGVIRCTVVAPAAHHHNHRSAHAVNALREQVWPYMTGEPWKFARGAMVQWQGSHMEDDVRKAAAVLGGFSVQEIVERYSNPAQLKLQLQGGLMERTVEKMIFKPAAHYDQWFPMAVDLLIPIFVQLRQSMGVAAHLVPDARLDLLLMVERVRKWKPTDGDLRLTHSDLKHVPLLKHRLQETRMQEKPLLIRHGKVAVEGKRVMSWILDGPRLAEALGK